MFRKITILSKKDSTNRLDIEKNVAKKEDVEFFLDKMVSRFTTQLISYLANLVMFSLTPLTLAKKFRAFRKSYHLWLKTLTILSKKDSSHFFN